MSDSQKNKTLILPELKNRRRFKYIDTTPDEEYPLRILRAYLADAQTEWIINGKTLERQKQLYAEMNKYQALRREILIRAIEKLSK